MNNKHYQHGVVVLFALLLIGCVGKYSPEQVSSVEDDFPSFLFTHVPYDFKKDAVIRDKRKMVYVKMNNHSYLNSLQYQDLVMRTMSKMGFFDEVVTHSPVVYINAYPKGAKRIGSRIWYDTVDPLSIKQIREIYPNKQFLIADVTLREAAPDSGGIVRRLRFDIKIINPHNGSTLFYAHASGRAWFGVNRTLIYPVFNTVKHWLVAKSAHT